ncbi:pyoverdine/dityrosine biosynthesis protein [Dactylonectria macrodidyma]|uniref:Pyoverdine/dityrosine biosynthesis protein n=1 Tax=Dactylonectria macrodidyma TaxID=307937 RepID=A0A9P9E5R1_9HYPO|nr:pyoverdine/dityrosine biosynthesis protein [Dactylonectria macrodidyma]
MEVSNAGVSVFHRFQASFVHDGKGTLLYTSGPRKQLLQDNWAVISTFIHVQESTKRPPNRTSSIDIDEPVKGLRLYQQCQLQEDGTAKGILLAAESKDNTVGEDFEQFFVQLVLDQLDFALYKPTEPSPEPSPLARITGKIVSLFDSYLRFQGPDDKWEQGGRQVFEARVRHFTSQGAQIQMCLPAFPCKSTNTNKVIGTSPDRGEALALNHLHSFVEAVEKIYKPGAKLWVISDGHVFSDCIGVDDNIVDRYTEELKEMNHEIGLSRGRLDRIDFRSLIDLFQLGEAKAAGEIKNLAASLSIPGITHHVPTKETEEAEVCRQILMAGTQPLESVARDRLKSNDETLIALYRGFSRFMLEDLELHPSTKTQTKSQRKKLSTKVAFEMILRNQAYSNLVEILYPNYVRLSIHAHNNAGPKFGIQLFDASKVRVVENLSPDGIPMASEDLLHVPTPWHNSVVEMEGCDYLLVTKAKVAQHAVDCGAMGGGKITTQGGAYFLLQESVKEPVKLLQRAMSFAPVEEPTTYEKVLKQAKEVFAPLPVLVSIGLIVMYRFQTTRN